MAKKKIIFQGEPGANSHIACREAYPDHEPIPCPTFEDCFSALLAGDVDLGMIPIENSVAGRVADIHHLMPTSGLHIIAEWTQDTRLFEAVAALPDLLDQAWQQDWSAALPVLHSADHLYVVGRGHGFGVAQEMALKIKETCGFHAEAFSAAEVRHGPMAIVEKGFPVLLLGQDDESRDSVADLAPEFAERGALVLSAGLKDAPGLSLPSLDAHPVLQRRGVIRCAAAVTSSKLPSPLFR